MSPGFFLVLYASQSYVDGRDGSIYRSYRDVSAMPTLRIFIHHNSSLYTVSQKTVQTYFCQNFGKFRPIVKIFGRQRREQAFLRYNQFPPYLVEIEYTSEKLVLFDIFVPNIIFTIGRNLPKFWQKIGWHSFF